MHTSLLIALALALYFFDAHFNTFAKMRNKAAFLVATLQQAVNAPFDWYQELKQTLGQKKDLVIANEKLNSQLLQQQTELQQLHYLEQENAQLRQLLQYTKHVKQRILTAQLLTAKNDGFGQNIINRGQQDGVYVGQPVIDPYGVFGRVTTIAPNMSSIMLITNEKSAIPVVNVRSGLRAIAVGNGQDSLELANIPETADIQIGDLLITSGVEKIFPAGFLVGTVKSAHKVIAERFMRVIISPTAHLASASHIFLVWPHNKKEHALNK